MVDSDPRADCFAGSDGIASLCRLVLDPLSPLTPRTHGMERVKPPEHRLGDGVWWARINIEPQHRKMPFGGNTLSGEDLYFVVAGATLRIVNKAEAYVALGAVEALHAMGLGDAAVSLSAGDFDHASVQVIAERERQRGG